MIVFDQGDSWQVVAQPDHGDVCAAIVAAWGNERFERSPGPSLEIAARRHDDGWAIWERTPDVDHRSGDGRPLNVFDIGIDVHLAFFRAMITAVADEDPYAGVLASMHAVGLYSQRFGTDPSLKMTLEDTRRDEVDAFLAQLREEHDAKAAELGIPEDRRWVDYKLLQMADRLCLYLCLNDLVGGTEARIGPAPTSVADDGDIALALAPVGPWEIALDPYPFGAAEVELELPRRVFPKRAWSSREEFAAAYRDAEVERRKITFREGSGR
ncbi:MAG: DUF3891 family protein [Actinobacteria bacterium]|nr:DUF3891 family protein [Actinomycetota bacterium]